MITSGRWQIEEGREIERGRERKGDRVCVRGREREKEREKEDGRKGQSEK